MISLFTASAIFISIQKLPLDWLNIKKIQMNAKRILSFKHPFVSTNYMVNLNIYQKLYPNDTVVVAILQSSMISLKSWP